MKRFYRTRRNFSQTANPFVVLADVTIAMAFIFAVHGLAAIASNSQALQAAKRLKTQDDLRQQFLRTIQSLYPGTRIEKRRKPGDKQDHYLLISNDAGWSGIPVAEVWNNDNLQRLIINGQVFDVGGHTLRPEGDKLYDLLATHLKNMAPQLTYIYIHGIVEKAEMSGSGGPIKIRRDAVDISRRRADDVYERLKNKGVIGPATQPDKPTLFDGTPCVPAKYAIAYGTGSDLYFRNTVVGRVDLVLFFK